ncbi:hypothetical protein Lalb_Chr18g0050441 [Lupinus albus]|uniref:Uncharacterized protein n=1 Tax=Lupinus albus TaxID=3870 RepID=A0A6A4NPQ6_LUPAL|nr:hypothetical protein Lalb_Chr18g0050441 [Lupinus albus]
MIIHPVELLLHMVVPYCVGLHIWIPVIVHFSKYDLVLMVYDSGWNEGWMHFLQVGTVGGRLHQI